MTRRPRFWLGLAVPAALALVASCNDPYRAETPRAAKEGSDPAEDHHTLLRTIVQLIETAATTPNNDNFSTAAKLLNDYFLGTSPAEYRLPGPTREYLATQELPRDAMAAIEATRFDGLRDGRHIEDCLLYRTVAARVAGDGDDLIRAGRVFDWVIRNIQLVPAGSLGAPGIGQAQARPYDVLVRGMATEATGGPGRRWDWAERSWLFLALCRQLEIEAGLIAVMPPARGPSIRPPDPVILACGVLADGRVSLFDARLGLPIPGPDGRGVATLEQAATDPDVLTRLDLPGLPYPVHQADLAAGRVRVLLESSVGTLSPRMRLLQEKLSGKNRMILHRDPVDRVAAFKQALGPRCEAVDLWRLPLEVEWLLFHDGRFVQATGFPLQIFHPSWPLVGARLQQLRGDLPGAVQRLVGMRFAEGLVAADDKTPIPPDVQQVLDVFATYFLALAKLDQGDADQAGFLLGESLKLLPEPQAGKRFVYYYMFRWGALANLARLREAEGELPLAIRYYGEASRSDEAPGLLFRARELLRRQPFAPEPGSLPAIPRPAIPDPPAPGPAGPTASRVLHGAREIGRSLAARDVLQ